MTDTQQTIPGTADVVSAEVADAGRAYTKTLASRQALQKKEDTLRAELISLMEAEGVEEFVVGDKRVTLETIARAKLAVETLKEDK